MRQGRARDEDMAERAGEREVHLHDYLRILQRRRWSAVTVFVIIVATVVIGTFIQTPIYRATAKVLIDPEPPKAPNIQEVLSGETGTDYRATQWEIITARPVVERVIETLNLKRRIPKVGQAKDPVEAFLDFLTVAPKRNTRLVEIHVDHPSAALAAEVATGMAQAYARFNLDQKLKSSREVIVWLSEQLNELKAQVQDSAVALQKYRSTQGVLGSQEQRQITASKIMDFNRAYLEAQAQRMSVEAKLQELRRAAQGKDGLLTMFTVADSPLLQKLRADASTLQAERSKLLKVFKDKHPEVRKVDAQLRQGQERFEAELQNLVRAVETEFKVAKAREQTLLGNVQALSREAQAFNEKEIQHLSLVRESESNQSLYELVLKRLKETGVATGIETNNVHVLQEATVPARPYRPRKALNVALALAVGLFAGIGTAFFVDYLDRTIKTPEDVERYLDVPVVGIVPAFAEEALRALMAHATAKRPSSLICETDPRSPAAEAYRTLRSNLQFSALSTKGPHVLLVASASPREGKSTTVGNLGVVLAQAGSRVCLIDSDLRRPSLHRVFGLGNAMGLTTALLNETPVAGAARPTRVENLAIVTSGPVPPNPAELLSSKAMQQFLEGAGAAYDVVILDSAPVLAVSDASVLAPRSNGVVLVVRVRVTPHQAVQRAIEQLEGVGGKVAGVLLNAVDLRRDGYYYRYYTYSSVYGTPEAGDTK